MIRFGVIVSVVAVAVGLLIVGAVVGKLELVYLSIGLAALALLMLIVGVAVWKDQVFGAPGRRAAPSRGGGAAGIRPADQHAAAGVTARPALPAEHEQFAPVRPHVAQSAGSPPPQAQPLQAQPLHAPAPHALPPHAPSPLQPLPQVPAALQQTALQQTGPQQTGTQQTVPAQQPAPFRPAPAPAPAWAPERPRQFDRPLHVERPAAEWPAERVPVERAPVEHTPPERVPPERVPAGERTLPPVAAATRSTLESSRAPADDPVRLARRLDSAAELTRQQYAQAVPPRAPSPPPGRSVTGLPPEPVPDLPVTSGPAPTRFNTDVWTRLATPATAPDEQDASFEAPAAAAPAPHGRAAEAPSARPDAAEDAPVSVAASDVRSAGDTRSTGDMSASSDEPDSGIAQAARAPLAADASSPDAAGGTATDAKAGTTAGAGSAASRGDAGEEAAVTSDPATVDPALAATPATGQVSVVPGIARYHRSDCILIRFLGEEDLEVMSRQNAEDSGSVPCKACRPDKDLTDA